MLLLVYLVLCAWAFELLLILGVFIKNAKYKDIYIFSIVLLISLVFLFLLWRLFFDNKPKFKDWKYVWKDWRVYEWDWDKNWANWKWKLTRADWSYYEWEFKNGEYCWKWKKVLPNWESYEWEFKNGKPHWMWIIKMKNWYYYEWEFSNWTRTWRFKKQILTTWWAIEWEFRDNRNNWFDWIWEVSTSDWFVFEWTFKNWNLEWEWKMTTPNWDILLWMFDNWELKTWKKILKNGEYCEWNWVNWCLTWLARYYFKDGSYYEWECGEEGWRWIWTYVTKKEDKYPTEFPYDIINVFKYWVSEKIREIDKNLNYIPKTEKEKDEEKYMYLRILDKWTSLQKEIVRLNLEEYEKDEMLLDSIKRDNSIWNILKFHKGLLKSHEVGREDFRKLIKKCHIKNETKSSCYSYWEFLNKLDCMYGKEHDVNVLYIKIDEFLYPKNILNFIINREKKEKERVIMIDEFSVKYEEYIKTCLDWRDYEKKFWKRNFKPDKNSY